VLKDLIDIDYSFGLVVNEENISDLLEYSCDTLNHNQGYALHILQTVIAQFLEITNESEHYESINNTLEKILKEKSSETLYSLLLLIRSPDALFKFQ
jgi:hypothetical protein